MRTKAKFSTKMISLLLSVLMAASCFGIALPHFAPTAAAEAASEAQWQTLKDALTAAQNGGYLGTDTYAVTVVDGGSVVVNDTSKNGYLYAVVSAVGTIAAAEGYVAEGVTSDHAHNGLLAAFIIETLEDDGFALTQYQEDFIKAILPVGAGSMYERYNGKNATTGGTPTWTGSEADMNTNLPESYSFTTKVTRGVKGAVLTDYTEAAAVLSQVEVQCIISFSASRVAVDSGSYKVAHYENNSVTVQNTTEAAPDLSAIIAYLNYVRTDAGFAPGYAAWKTDPSSVYFEDADVLMARYEAYMALRTPLDACDPDYIDHFIGVESLNDWTEYARVANASAGAVLAKRYVDWINGLPMGGDSINKLDYSAGDRLKMEALRDQAQSYLNTVNALSEDTRQVLSDEYGYLQQYQLTADTTPTAGKTYYTQVTTTAGDPPTVMVTYVETAATAENISTLYELVSYENYIRDLNKKIELFNLADLRTAAQALMRRDASNTYVFPAQSRFASFSLTSDTEPASGKTYYEKHSGALYNDYYSVATGVTAENISSFYEAVGNELLCVGDRSYYSEDFVLAGETCPVSYLDLITIFEWFNTAYNTISTATYAGEIFTAEEIAEIGNMRQALSDEIVYREADDNSAAWRTEYAYFVDLMLNTDPTMLSDEALIGYDVEVEGGGTQHVLGLLDTALQHKGQLDNAFISLNFAGNDRVRAQYVTFQESAQAYIGNVAKVLLDRCYDEFIAMYKDAKKIDYSVQVPYGSATEGYTIDNANFSLIKARFSNLDDDRETPGLQNNLYSKLNSYQSGDNGIEALVNGIDGSGTGKYNDIHHIFGWIWNADENIDTYMKAAEACVAADWTNFAQYVNDTVEYSGGTTGTAGQITGRTNNVSTGIYTVRDGRADDMVRKDDNKDYLVTDTKIYNSDPNALGVIQKLDKFATSQQLVKLLGAYDEEAGVTSLSGYINKLLVENLFSDEMVNTIVSMLFPMLQELVDDELVGMVVSNVEGASENPDPEIDFNLNLNALATGYNLGTIEYPVEALGITLGTLRLYLSQLSGTVEVSLNGHKGTEYLKNVFAGLGVKIWPSTLRDYMYNNYAANGQRYSVKYSNFYSALENAVNNGGDRWAYFNTAYVGDDPEKVDKNDFASFGWGVSDYDTFIDAMSLFIGAAGPIINTLFTNYTLSTTVGTFVYAKASDVHLPCDPGDRINVGTLYATGSGTITIDGMKGYSELWAPLFEALGLGALDNSKITSNNLVNASTPFSNSLGTSGIPAAQNGKTSTGVLLEGLFRPLMVLVDQLCSAPIETVLNLLPNLAYYISHDGILPLMDCLQTKLHVKASPKLTGSISGLSLTVWGVNLGLSWLANLLEDTINNRLLKDIIDVEPDINFGSLLNIKKLLPFDLTNLNDILKYVIGELRGEDVTEDRQVDLPPINAGRIGGLGTKQDRTSVRSGGVCHYVKADAPDVLYELLRMVLTFVAQSGNLSGLITTFSGNNLGTVGEILEPILGAIDTDKALAALVELFIPQTYDMTPYDWYLPNSAASTYNFGTTFNQANFTYLKYQNDWTRTKAQYLFDHLEEAVDDIVAMIDGDMLDGYDGFSDWLLKFINKMFNNQGINNVLDLLMKLVSKLDNESKMVANLLKDQISADGAGEVDTFSWYHSFGYLYPEFRVLGTHEISTTDEETGVTTTTTVDEVIYTKNDGYGNPIYCVGYPETYTQKIAGHETTLTKMHFVRTYPLAPSNFKGFIKNEDGSYSLAPSTAAASETYGEYNEKRITYEYAPVSAITSLKTYDHYVTIDREADPNYDAVKGSNFSNISVRILDEPDENENVIIWSVTGNANTAPFGVASGHDYTLADGEMGTEDNAVNPGVSARAVFTAIFASLAEPLAPVLSFLLNGKDLSFFDGTLTIEGYDVYNGALIPVLEMLGVNNLLNSEQYNAQYGSNATGGFYYLTNATFSALTNLLSKDASGTPMQKLIELLPRIYYFLQSDGLSTFLRNMLMPIWVLVDDIRPIADVNLDVIIHNLLAQLLGVDLSNTGSDEQNAISSLVNRFLNLSPILTTQLSNTEQIVAAIESITLQKLRLKDIANLAAQFTGMDLYPLFYAFEGMCNGYTLEDTTRYGVMTYQSAHYDIAYYNNDGSKHYDKTYTLRYAGPDTVTVTVCAVLDLLRYGNNAAALDNLIGLTRELLPGETQETALTAAGLLEGLEIVFEQRGSLTYQHPNWDYLLEGKAVKGPDGNVILWSENLQITKDGRTYKGWEILLLYNDLSELDLHHKHDDVTKRALAYKSDWTRETAVGMDQMFRTVLDYVTTAFLAKDDDSIQSFEEFANSLINEKLLGAATLKTLAGYIALMYNFLPASVVGVLDTLLQTDLLAWRNAGYIRQGDANNVATDNDGNPIKETDDDGNPVFEADGETPKYVHEDSTKYYINLEFKWWAGERVAVLDEENNPVVDNEGHVVTEFVPAGDDYVDTRDEFFDAITELLTPVSKLLGFIFLEDSYKLFYSVGDTISVDDSNHEGTHDVTPGDDEDAIVLDGAGAWGKGLIPLLEALGIEKILNDKGDTLKHYAPSVYCSEEEPGIFEYDCERFVADFIYLVRVFAEGVIADPVNWLLDNLANVIYFINADGISTAVANIFDSVQSVLDTVNTQLDADSRISTANLGGINLSHLTLEGIFKLVERFTGWTDENNVHHTGLHINDELIQYIKDLYIGQLTHYNSANGYVAGTVSAQEIQGVDAFRMDPVAYPADYTGDPDDLDPEAEYRADLITVFLALVVEIAEDSGRFVDPDNGYNYSDYDNPAVIDHLAGTDGMVTDIIHAIRNPLDLVYKEINWFYPYDTTDISVDEGDGRVLNVPKYMFQYLNYTTQWTYTKAAATAAGLEDMVISILGLVNSEQFGEMESLGELLNVDKFYSGEYLQKLLDLVSGFLYGEDAILSEEILNVVGALLGADLRQWNGNYAFGSAADFEGVTLLGPDESGLKYAMLPIMAQQVDENDEPVFEEDGVTPVMVPTGRTQKTYLVNDRASFVAGATLFLKPAYRLLDWLLFGADYGFFTGNTASSENDILIQVPGSDGYAEGLVLLLEALGCTGLKYTGAYKGENGAVDTGAFMSDLLTSLCDRIDEIIADPVNQISALIPELIYFINAGGLQTVVLNLLAGPIALVNAIDALKGLGGDGDENTVSDEEKTVVDTLIGNLLNNALKDKLGDRTIDFKMDDINLQFIFEIVEAFTGLEITDVVHNRLDYFFMGDLVRYTSMGGENGRTAYFAMFSSTQDFADFITILLSFALDIVRYEDEESGADNAVALANLIGGDDEQTKTIVEAVIALLREKIALGGEVRNIDWLYFDPAYSLYDDEGQPKDSVPEYDETAQVNLPERTINYLTYASDWTDELAHYIYNNRNELITSVLTLANAADNEVLGIRLGDLFTGGAVDLLDKLFTGDNLNTILNAIKGLTEKIPSALFDLLHIILDVDLGAYNTMEAFPEGVIGEEAFIDGLVQIVSPLGSLLDWLLFGENKTLQYFDKKVDPDDPESEIEVLLEIGGANGYDYGLVPILEALGVNPPTSDPGSTTNNMLRGILESLVARVKAILGADGHDPVDELLKLIPNLLYFINSKGLVVSLFNLLAGPLALLEEVNGVLDPDGTHPEKRVDINALLANLDLGLGDDFDIFSLDLTAIFNLLEGVLGVEIIGENGFVEEAKIKNFYFGTVELTRSANGKVRGTMAYTEDEDAADMLTIIVNFAIELALYEWDDEEGHHTNAEALEAKFNLDPGTISGIIEAIKTLGEKAAPGAYHWDYFNHDTDDYEFVDSEVGYFTRTGNNQFEMYLTYADGQLWKQETANNLYDNLGTLVDNIISMTSGSGGAQSLHDIIAGSFNLYTAANLNAILGLIQQGYDLIGEEFITLFGLVLGADLTSWNGLSFEDADVTDRDTFRTGLIEILKPLYPVLDWLLFGRDYAFFVSDTDGNLVQNERGENELLKIAGSEGYAYALAPLLTILGVEDLPLCTVGETKCGTVIEGRTFFDRVVEALLDRVDAILNDPIHEAFELLPQLLYFINANGLATVVQNLLGSVMNAGDLLVEKGVLHLENGTTIAEFIGDKVGINIANLDLEGIFAFVETLDALHGLKLNEVFTRDFDGDGVAENILEYFYAGAGAERMSIPVKKDGVNLSIYHLRIENGRQGDIITLLFSIVLEVLFYEGNEEAFTAIINGFLDQDPDDGVDAFTRDAFVAIKALLADGADPAEMQTMDWVYFNEYADDAARQAAILAVLTAQVNELPALPTRTQNYLRYDMNNNPEVHNLWTKDVVSYVDANLNEIVNKVIGLVTQDEFSNLNDFIRSKFDLFSQDTADLIVNALVNALGALDDAVLNTAGSLLGIQELASLKTAQAQNVTDKASFVNELSRILSPAEPLLKWLLFGGDFRFFTKLESGEPAILSIKGGKGYKYGLAPILNALGVATAIDENNIVHDLLMNVANRVEEILANPIDEVLNLLPELIYFINANGLGTAVTNLLNPIDTLLKTAGQYIGRPELSINSLVTAIDLEHLDFNAIFGILKDATGIVLSDEAGEPIGQYLSTFYFGRLEYVTIYDDPDPAEPDLFGFKMVYTPDGDSVDGDTRYDMITILVALVLDVVTFAGNEEAIVNLLKNINEEKAQAMYNAIIAFLTHHEVQVEMVPYRWILTEYATDSSDPTKAGKVLTPGGTWDETDTGSIFGPDLYGPMYTRAMGEYITRNFTLFVNVWIKLLGIEDGRGGTYNSLDDLLNGLIGTSIYKTSLLESVEDAVSGAVENLENMVGAEMFDYIVAVLEKSLGVDITTLTEFEITPFADGDREAFVNQLCEMASLVAPILRWLLTGQSIALFTDREGKDYIVIEGAHAYKDSIIPILEALHAPAGSIMTQAEYEAATAEDDAAMLKLILIPILDRVDEILADPLTEMFDILPGLAYFINSQGLDSAFKNVLNAVFKVLYTIDPLIADVEKLHKDGELSLYPLLGENFDLETMNFSAIGDMLLGLVNNAVSGTGFELTGILDNAINELTLGVVTPFQSKRGEKDYTMHYAGAGSGSGGGAGDQVDLATIVMHVVLNFISKPENVAALEELLDGKVEGDAYLFVCALLENFQAFAASEGGMDKIMYSVYYIFYTALSTGVVTNNTLANFNYNYSFMNKMFAESKVGFFQQMAKSFGGLLDKYSTDVIDHDEAVPNGFIRFFQSIINFFKKIGIFFRNLFNR